MSDKLQYTMVEGVKCFSPIEALIPLVFRFLSERNYWSLLKKNRILRPSTDNNTLDLFNEKTKS